MSSDESTAVLDSESLELQIPEAGELRERLFDQIRDGLLFVPRSEGLDAGAEVELQFSSAEESEVPSLRGSVSAVPPDEEKHGPGVWVELDPPGDGWHSLLVDEPVAASAEDSEAEASDGGANDEALEAARERAQQAVEDLRAAHKEQRKTEKQLAVYKQRLSKVQNERDELVAEKVNLETELESLVQPVEQVSVADYEELERRTERLEERLEEAKTRAVQLEADLDQHRSDEEVTRGLAERLATEKSATEAAARELREEVDAELAEARAQVADAQSDRDDAQSKREAEVQALKEEVDQLRETNESLEEEVESERKSRVEFEARLDKANSSLSEGNAAVLKAKGLEGKLQRIMRELEESQDGLERATERASTAEKELEESRTRERDLRRLLAALDGTAPASRPQPDADDDASSAPDVAAAGDDETTVEAEATPAADRDDEEGAAHAEEALDLPADESSPDEDEEASAEASADDAETDSSEQASEDVSDEAIDEAVGEAEDETADEAEELEPLPEPEDADVDGEPDPEPAAPAETVIIDLTTPPPSEGELLTADEPLAVTAQTLAKDAAVSHEAADSETAEPTPTIGSAEVDPATEDEIAREGDCEPSSEDAPVTSAEAREETEAPLEEGDGLVDEALALEAGDFVVADAVDDEAGFAQEIAEPVDETTSEEALLEDLTTGERSLLESALSHKEVESSEEFIELISSGARIVRTPRFSRLEPVSLQDIQVSDWLKESERYAEILDLCSGRIPEPKLQKVLALFFERDLIRILR